MNDSSLDIRADDVELQSLLDESRQSGELGGAGLQIQEEDVGLLSKQTKRDARKSTPVPYLQVALFAIMRASSPMFFMVVFPYINPFLISLGVADEVHVGFYSGWIETVLAVGAFVSVHFWAKLSDSWGRKPVLLTGIAINCLLSCMFGFCKTYWILLLLRFMMGFVKSAQAATTKVMMSELATSSNLAKCFALLGLGWQAGATSAPALGGILANPSETWPSVFEDTVFETYPYALPSIAVAVIPALATLVAIPLMVETHPKLVQQKRDSYKPKADSTKEMKQSFDLQSTSLPSLWSNGLAFVMVLFDLLLTHVLAFQAAELLFFFSSTAIGGIGLKQSQLSLYLASRPFLICLYEVNVFPRLTKRFGVEKTLRILVCLPPLVNLLYLLLSIAILNGTASNAYIVFTLGLSLILQVLSNPAFLAIDVLIPSRSPTQAQLSKVNAWNEIFAQVAVGLGAGAGSSIFAVSVSLGEGFWRGKLVWIVLFALSTTTAVVSQRLTHIPGWRERQLEMELKEES